MKNSNSPVTGVNHITFAVSDLDRAWHFYLEVLGMKGSANFSRDHNSELGPRHPIHELIARMLLHHSRETTNVRDLRHKMKLPTGFPETSEDVFRAGESVQASIHHTEHFDLGVTARFVFARNDTTESAAE